MFIGVLDMKFSVKDFFNKYEEFHSKKQPPQVFYAKRCSMQKGVLRNFAKFAGKHLYLRPATLLKKRFWHRCFRVNFVKFLRTSFLKNTSDGCFYTVTFLRICSHLLKKKSLTEDFFFCVVLVCILGKWI